MSSYQAKALNIKAAADYLGNGAIEINKYESEIVDIIRRNSVFLQRVDRRPATGHPHRFFEQTAIATATASDPRNISPTPAGPTRVERSAWIKATVAQTNLSLFDVDVTRQQGQFAYVEAKDIDDIMNAIVVFAAGRVWTGSDTSLTANATAEYCGLLTQLTMQSTIANGASIIDGLKSQVASLVANQTYNPKPTGIYLGPILGDYLDREAKAANITFGSTQVAGGVTVKTLSTQAGDLPLISDVFLPTTAAGVAAYGFSAVPTGMRGHYAVILTEPMVEMPVVHGGDGNMNPRLFQLGLLAGLQGQYVGVLFDAVIGKGPSYAHAVVQVIRP